MSIWIRSQDKKTLINVDSFFIRTVGTGKYDMFSENDIVYQYEIVADNDGSVGAYPTESEALQVLDMIQGQIYALFSIAPEERVYQMPVFEIPEAGFSQGEG